MNAYPVEGYDVEKPRGFMMTIYYDACKFKAQTITPSLRKMIDEDAKIVSEKFNP